MSAEATGARRTVRRPFFFKIALVIAATVSLSLALLGWVVLDANEETLEDLSRSRQHLALEDVARSVEASLRANEDVLETIGRVIVETPDAQADAIPSLVASFVSGASGIDAVAIYGADGARIDVVREANATTSLPPTLGEEARDLATDQGSLGSVEDDGSVLSIVPLRTSDGVTGFVAARTSLRPIAQHIEQLGVRHFGNVEAPILLVDAEGRALAGLGPDMPAVPSAYTTGLEASAAGSYAEIVGTGSDARLVTIERVDLRPFRIVVSEPTSVVFASVRELRR